MMKKRSRKRAAVKAATLVFASLCGTMFSLQTSCTKEDTEHCECKALLYIDADREGADKIDYPDGATVFFFNSNRTYRSFIHVSAKDIAARKAVPVFYNCGKPLWVAAWGNLGDNEKVSPLAPGIRMEDMYVSMGRDPEGYAVAMDHLFFGIKQLSEKADNSLVISPKTGRITITVKGLQDNDPNHYFFTVNTPYDKYDFSGNPQFAPATLRFTGVFRENNLVTAKPYHLVHFPLSGADCRYLVVELYKKSGESGESQLIATTSTDKNNYPITIQRGKTTNILITITSQGLTGINVKVSDWDVIEQWDDW